MDQDQGRSDAPSWHDFMELLIIVRQVLVAVLAQQNVQQEFNLSKAWRQLDDLQRSYQSTASSSNGGGGIFATSSRYRFYGDPGDDSQEGVKEDPDDPSSPWNEDVDGGIGDPHETDSDDQSHNMLREMGVDLSLHRGQPVSETAQSADVPQDVDGDVPPRKRRRKKKKPV